MSKTGVLTVKVVGDAKPFEKTMGKLSKTASVAFAAVGVAGAAALSKGFADSLSNEKALDKVAASMGLDPEQSAKMGKIAGELYSQAYGESLGQVANAASAVQQNLGELDDSQVKGLTANALDFAAAFDTDVNEAINSAGFLLKNGLVADGQEAFDILTVAMQRIPPGVRDEVLSATEEYSTFFADLGISGEEAFSVITKAAQKGGKFGVDKVGDAFKELTIRATDGSKASAEAYAMIGLNGDKMAKRFVAGGDTARGALDDLISGLKGMKNPVDRANAAIGLFGTPLEDLSVSEIPEFLGQIENMKFGMGDIDGAAAAMGDTLNDNLGTKIETLKRTALMGLSNFVGGTLIPAMEKLGPAVSVAAAAIGQVIGILFKGDFKGGPFSEDSKIVDVFFDIREAAVSMFEAVSGWIADVGPAIQSWVEDVLGNLSKWWSDNGPKIISIAEKLRDALIKAFEKIVRAIQFVVRNWDKFKVAVAFAVGIMIPHFIALGVQAVLSSVKQVGAWAAANAAAIAGAVTHSAQIAIMVAKWAFIGVQSLLHAAKVAAAWLIAMGPIGLVIAAVVGLVVIIVKNWDTIKKVIAAGWEWVKRTTASVWDGIKSAVSTAVGAVVGFVTGIPGRIAGVVSTMWNGIKTGIEAARSFVGEKIDAVVGFVTGMPRRISTAASGLFDGIKNAFRGALNWIIDKWNGLSFTLPAIDIPGIGKIGGATLSTPNIPRLATGGVVSSPTLALVGDAGRGNPEIVAPEQMLRRIMREEGGGTTNHYHISGIGDRELLRVVRDAIESANRSGI